MTLALPDTFTTMTRRTQGEGSVYMRKDGRAAASAIYEGKRITKYGKTKTEAKQKLDAYLNDLRTSKVVIAPKQTVGQYLEYWLENSHRLQLRASSAQKYRGVLRNHLIPALGYLELSSLTRQHVQTFYAQKVNEGLRPKTVKLIHVVLSRALKDAVRDCLLARNVCEHTTLPRMDIYEAHVFTQEECQRLIDVARGYRLWPLLLVAIVTGARRGELLALRWDDVDMDTGVVRLHRTVDRLVGLGNVENETKTIHGMRSVRLPQVAIDALLEQKTYIAKWSQSAFWQGRNLVFPGRFGNYIDGSKLLQSMKAILREAGLPIIRFHDLRHSAATLLLAAGVNPKVVQELLGHSSISVTLGMYGHILPNMQKDVSNRMDDMFGQHS